MLFSGGTLDDLKTLLKAQIDAEAEMARASIITLGAGQAMAYEQKYREAQAYLADPTLSALDVPHIFNEAEVEAVTPEVMAQMIVASAQQWTLLSSRIEALRIGAKRAVEAATNTAAANAAAVVDWTTIQQ